jgi:hypothetical protein
MKTLLNLLISIVLVFNAFIAQAENTNEFGVYKTKEDYLSKTISVIDKMQSSENYNLGILIFLDKENKEQKMNCIKEKYFGFRYIDGFDYIQLDGFYAKLVSTGRIDLLISPKADFKKDEKGKYIFSRADNGKVSFYFMKDLNPKTLGTFEKLIADEKAVVKEYQKDRDNYGDFINKQLVYLNKYNETIPKKKLQVKTKNAVAKR